MIRDNSFTSLGRFLTLGWFCLAMVSLSACSDKDNEAESQPLLPKTFQDSCGDLRMSAKVFYGTVEPTYLPLELGQLMAIGQLKDCTGLLVTARWVITASHCGIQPGDEFCVGVLPGTPNLCTKVERVVHNDMADMALLRLEKPSAELDSRIVPIPIIAEVLSEDWIARPVEAAGYGDMEDGNDGVRKFSAEKIVELTSEMITIYGDGERGVCFGDSGGPLMALADDGSVRVIGILSHGDESCVGYDHFTRVDPFIAWIESVAGPTFIEDSPCRDITQMGRCIGESALWCDDLLEIQKCDDDGRICGWDPEAIGFRCIDGDDLCQGYDGFGECVQNKAHWCEAGELRMRDCNVCGQNCDLISNVQGVYCIDDPCFGLDYYGRCNGEVLEWCEDGEFRSRDCATLGKDCELRNTNYGYACL